MIKAIVADALGMHLDQFQRIVVDPCSVSVVRYTPLRPFVAAGQRQRRRPARSLRPAAGAEAPRRRGARRPVGVAPPRVGAVVGGSCGGRHRDRRRVASMPRQVYDYDPPERFVAGTVGAARRAHVLPAGRGPGRA